MDIPKIYVAGEKKHTIFSSALAENGSQKIQVIAADTYESEYPAEHCTVDTAETDRSDSGGGRMSSRSAVATVTVVLTLFFCAVTATVTGALLINFGRPAAKAVAELMEREIYGGAFFYDSSPNTAVSENGPGKDNQSEHDSVEEAADAPCTDISDAQSDVSSSEETTDKDDESQTYPIIKLDLSVGGGDIFALQNETGYSPNMVSLSEGSLPSETLEDIRAQYGNTAPAVLIIHTHGTESYLSDGADSLDGDAVFRSDDISENVVAVGSVMAQTLSQCGIGVIHSTVMYDKDDYKNAYDSSAAAVRDYLERYPSIKYIFDVHRDSVTRSDGSAVAPVTELYGKSSAQVMLVAGTDEGGAAEYDWEKNLTLAALIQKRLSERCASLPRRINLRRAAFNQGIAPGYLLIEVGSHATTLSEAKRGAAAAAIAIAEVLGADVSPTDAEQLISHAGDDQTT